MSLNAERLADFISDIERARERLRPLGAMPLEKFMASEDSQDIARSRLLVAIQAALGICYHICAQETRHVPRDYADCFRTLGKAGIIETELAERLASMAKFRNLLVHVYWDADFRLVHRFIREGFDDLDAFVHEVARLV